MKALLSQLKGYWLSLVYPVAVVSITLSGGSVNARTPDRIANIWDGLAHQPSRAEVRQDEQSQGVSPPRAQRNATDEELNRLAQMLLSQH
jgi:hypothetical protein